MVYSQHDAIGDHMTKKEAAELFGNYAKLARALGITKSAISGWPDDLRQDQIDRVVGAAIRLGKRPKQKSAA